MSVLETLIMTDVNLKSPTAFWPIFSLGGRMLRT